MENKAKATEYAKTLGCQIRGNKFTFDVTSYLQSPNFRHFLTTNEIPFTEKLKNGKLVYELA